MCWSFKFFGEVSSLIVINLIAHLYVFASTTSTTSMHSPLRDHHLKLKSKSNIYLFIYCINLSVPHRL